MAGTLVASLPLPGVGAGGVGDPAGVETLGETGGVDPPGPGPFF